MVGNNYNDIDENLGLVEIQYAASSFSKVSV